MKTPTPKTPLPRPGDKDVRIAIRCSPAQRKKMMRRGGSKWLRKLIDQA